MKDLRLLICLTIASVNAIFSNFALAEPPSNLRERIKERIQDRVQERALTPRQDKLSEHVANDKSFERTELAGVTVAIWYPKISAPYPLVIFSHGFHGSDNQSIFLMKALASAGFMVVAPSHRDALNKGCAEAQANFAKVNDWSSSTYADRKTDIENVVKALHTNSEWKDRVDWSKFALAGHSLGGYTVLGLAGAWPDWKMPEVKAVLALSPYCAPYLMHHTMNKVKVPVMFQGGTKDLGITPSLKRKDGAFEQANSPAYLVEFQNGSHFSWTNFKRNNGLDEPIEKYSIAFLNKYLKGKDSPILKEKLSGVSLLSTK